MNKIIRLLTGLLFALLLMTSSYVNALTLTIPDVNSSPSETIDCQLLVEDFNNVGGLQLYVEYDTTKLVFDTSVNDLQSPHLLGWETNVIDGRIIMIWVGQALTLADGETLASFSLLAKPNATQSAEINFSGINELVDYAGELISLTLNNGIISFTPLDADDDDGALPLAFSLGQNYPNPFNPSTKIDFTVNDYSQRFTFRVFNMAGQIIEERDLGVLSVGAHPIHYYGEGLASGLYLYEVSSNTQKASKLMLLVK
ncbi:MAG: T9SS type A sorting domain-containing protein [candidate division Zixibacteria bacterium]|nr:T9SS type A sorting domain-containing protein [candidate division Zixibacteria bacterium]